MSRHGEQVKGQRANAMTLNALTGDVNLSRKYLWSYEVSLADGRYRILFITLFFKRLFLISV